ncbi:MAG: L,D-transpeptidase [Verrucomicrobiales bacterium]
MTANVSSLLRVLVSPAALPSEDDEALPKFSDAGAASGLARTLARFQQLARPCAVRFRLKGTEIEWPTEPAAELSLVEMEDSNSGLTLDESPAGSNLSWAAVAEAFARRVDSEHFLGGPAEVQRILLDEIRHAACEAARFFGGEPLPLVEITIVAPQVTEFVFLGVWLQDQDDAAQLLSALPRQRWDDGLPAADGVLLVLDDPEAEGRGLRDAVAGLLLAVVFTSQPAQAGLFGFLDQGPTPVLHESKATVDGTPLVVKSQKLVQAGPKIYPSGLIGQGADAPRKVVVDIKAQRAYLFVDGNLAFETPVSTASKGRTTPRGTFTITEKIRKGKHSTIYKSAMPYWNRLDQTAIGMHTGQLPGYPASHGCIRMPDEAARFMFEHASRGTTVEVVDGLAAAPTPTPAAAGVVLGVVLAASR